MSGALAGQHLNLVALNAEGHAVAEKRYLGDLSERIGSVTEGPDEKISLKTESGRAIVLIEKQFGSHVSREQQKLVE